MEHESAAAFAHDDDDIDDDEVTDADYQQPVPGCSFDDFVMLKFPKKIMECEDICSASDRLALSDNQVTAIVSAVLKAGGADLNHFSISCSTTRRNRMMVRYNICHSQMSTFRENPPEHAALHWDGKMLKDVAGTKPGSHTEALAVLVSGKPCYTEGKLLGVPFIDNSTGIMQAQTSYDLLKLWDLTDSISGLVFDTTASNSGIHRGAAKLLEEMLGNKVFYLACRHHILEVLIGAVWER